MADYFVNQTEDYDGSPDVEDDVITATGSIKMSLNGVLGGADLKVYSRLGDNGDFNIIWQSKTIFTKILIMAANEQWYAVLSNSGVNTDCTLSYLDVS